MTKVRVWLVGGTVNERCIYCNQYSIKSYSDSSCNLNPLGGISSPIRDYLKSTRLDRRIWLMNIPHNLPYLSVCELPVGRKGQRDRMPRLLPRGAGHYSCCVNGSTHSIAGTLVARIEVAMDGSGVDARVNARSCCGLRSRHRADN